MVLMGYIWKHCGRLWKQWFPSHAVPTVEVHTVSGISVWIYSLVSCTFIYSPSCWSKPEWRLGLSRIKMTKKDHKHHKSALYDLCVTVSVLKPYYHQPPFCHSVKKIFFKICRESVMKRPIHLTIKISIKLSFKLYWNREVHTTTITKTI